MNDAFGHPQSVVVLGGTSDIARELVTLLIGGPRSDLLSSPDTTEWRSSGWRRTFSTTSSEWGR